MSDATSEPISLRHEGEIAILSIDNAARRNAMTRAMRQRYRALVHQVMVADPASRALVLTGAGSHFSAGADIGEMTKRTIPQSREILGEFTAVVRDLVAGRKPVVAAVEGIAFGLGMSLACASDYVVCGAGARFCAAFLRIGLIPDTGILWSLPRRVGAARARELLGLAREVDAQEAQRIGLADRVCENGNALTEAIAVARELTRNPPLGMALIKSTLTYGRDTMDAALQAEIELQPVLRSSADHQEAARAFLEKRQPRFEGR
jgi:enoyl-CoA hydratase/carnithine racemase